MLTHKKVGRLIRFIEPGYDPDKNLLSMFSRTILEWVVDFLAGEPLKVIVCFDCSFCLQWWWGLGRASLIVPAINDLSSHGLAVVSHSGLLSSPVVPVLVALKLCADGQAECRQTEISYNTVSQRILWRISVDLLDVLWYPLIMLCLERNNPQNLILIFVLWLIFYCMMINSNS